MANCSTGPKILLVSRYTDPSPVFVGIEQYIVRNLSVRRGIDGPQIILSWEPPEDPEGKITLIRINRKCLEFPANEEDGAIVFEGPVTSTTFADCTDVPFDKCLYYRVWSYNSDTDEWVTSPAAEIAILSLFTGDDHWRKLFEQMGESIIVGDKILEKNREGRIVLEEDVALDGECFNIHEVGLDKGPLSRFYKTIGAMLDEAKELIDNIPGQRNVDTACHEYLGLIATLLGFELNRELPIRRQRSEIKNRVAILKIKGTLQSIEATIQTITGLNAEVKEWCGNIFTANSSRTLSLDPEEWDHLGTIDDTSHYLVSGKEGGKSCSSVSIFIDLLSSKECLPPEIIKKVTRAVNAVKPINVNEEICWLDEIYKETYSDAEETNNFTEIENFTSEGSPWDHCWFTANSFEQGVANSNSITPTQGGSCGEEWYDIIDSGLLVSKYSEPEFDSPSL